MIQAAIFSHTASRANIGSLIANTLSASLDTFKESYTRSGPIPYVVIDDLLPASLAQTIASAFPAAKDLTFKSTLRERKYVSSQMNKHQPLIEEALFAFHEPQVVSLIEKMTGHTPLIADAMLYAGGISRMEEGGFLNPHIDNSHNKSRTLWRSLNLLYYVTPGWQAHFGGNLEIWPHGVKDAPVTIESRFNRLVVMATHHESLHSVSPIRVNNARNCISNYYFSEKPMRSDQPFHVTSFRGRPEQPLRDLFLRADAKLRMKLRELKASGYFDTGHWYKRS